MMAVAELEAGMISARTKAALAASKARGKKLGGFRGRAGTAADTAKACAAGALKANAQARSIAPIIDRMDPDRTASLRGIARALNDEGVPTPSGEGTWTAATVARLRQRLELS
jgi:DNA invertase Pin-like site-specific DNA recombinase